MSTESPEEDPGELLPFKPMGEYTRPAMPTEESFRILLKRTKRLIKRDEVKPFITKDSLLKTDPEVLDAVAAPPAWGPLVEELEETLAEWAAQQSPLVTTKLIILPPGEENGLVAEWARQHDHQILDPPERLSLLAATPPPVPDLSGDGILVIPRLEYWFLRHHDGLHHLRQVLAALFENKRHCLIGCDSFAWIYLQRALGAELILPDSLTFQPFGAKRLGEWLHQLEEDTNVSRRTIRLSQNGADIFERGKSGKLTNDYLARLAARSRGIPWIAWDLWRSSLRSDLSQEEENEKTADIPKQSEDTLWIVESEHQSLPKQKRDHSLLILHALLIHGRLTMEELRLVIPIVGESFLVGGLISSCFVDDREGHLSCNRRAYPAIREELSAAGFPVDSF